MSLLGRFSTAPAGALTLALTWVLAAFSVPAQAQTTYQIDSLGDEPNQTNNALCISTAGTCTLRTALQASAWASSPVTIEVAPNIPVGGSGKSEIQVTSPLPTITVQTTIAGETHPNFAGDGFTNLVIVGVSGVANSDGLRVSGASGSTIRHIGIHGFGRSGIHLSSGEGHTVEGNVLGGSWVNTDINSPGNGQHGLLLEEASTSGNPTLVLNNVILANGGDGIQIGNKTASAVLQGNIIGLRPPLFSPGAFRPLGGNAGFGIRVLGSAGPDNLIGAFAGNTISNNEGPGIFIQGDSQTVRGNLIGVPHDGEVAPGFEAQDYGNDSMVNGFAVRVQGSNNVIGLSGAGRNTIGHSNIGVFLDSIASSSNEVAWNWIGVDSNGEPMPNTTGIAVSRGENHLIRNNIIQNNSNGMSINTSSVTTRNTITDNNFGIRIRGNSLVGGNDLIDANVIGNNSTGIRFENYLWDDPTVPAGLFNNYIGTNAAGASMPNAIGISVDGPDSTAWIGQGDGSGNVIVNSTITAIDLRDGATDVLIAGNRVGQHPDGTAMPNARAVRFVEASGVQIGFSGASLIDPETWSPTHDAGNIFAFNEKAIDFALASSTSVSNTIRGNKFMGNDPDQGLGIDLGMTAVDVGGNMDGPNTLLNYPEIDSDETGVAGSELTYRYRVRTAALNADYPLTIDFYLADGDMAQGLRFIGSDAYPATSAGNYRTGSLTLTEALPAGAKLVATATDEAGNTSQFTLVPADISRTDELFGDRFEQP